MEAVKNKISQQESADIHEISLRIQYKIKRHLTKGKLKKIQKYLITIQKIFKENKHRIYLMIILKKVIKSFQPIQD